MKQAAIYVRVSTQQQMEEGTIESQKETLLQFAKDKGFEIPSMWIFEDNGISGSTLARPALDRLRDYVSESLFTHLFVLSPDRLSRKYAYQALLMEEFNKKGLIVVFQNSPNTNTPGDNLLLQMQGMFAEYERAQITERSRRGKKHRAKNGCVSVLASAPYGYRYIKGVEGVEPYFEIIDREADVVREVFNLYAIKRLSIGEVQAYLLERNIKSPKGFDRWTRSSLTGLLSNSTYRGLAYYGMTERCSPDLTRLPGRQVRVHGRQSVRRGVRVRDPNEWIGIIVPSLVSEEIFELTQNFFSTNKKLSRRNTKQGSLLQGLISCKECGYSFYTSHSGKTSKGYHYYRCSKRDKNCNNRGIRINDLDEAIWTSLSKTLQSPDLIQDEISRRVQELKKEPILLRKNQLEEMIAKLEIEGDRLLDALQAGCITVKDLTPRMSALRKKINDTRREIEKVSAGLTPEQLMEIREAVACFSQHLKSSSEGLSVEKKRKILRMLIKEIQIGKEDITVKHIIPIDDKHGFSEIAHMCSDGGERRVTQSEL